MLFDLANLPAREQYKLMVSTVVPRPIAWVTTRSAEGIANAAPFAFFNTFGGSPPVVAIGLTGRDSGVLKDTRRNVEQTGEFVVNLVPHALAEAMNHTAIEYAPDTDELEMARLATLACQYVNVPRIAEAPVAMECRRHMLLDIGAGSQLLLGRVLAMHVRDDLVLDAERHHIDTKALDLVARMHGTGWYTRMTDWFEMTRPRGEPEKTK